MQRIISLSLLLLITNILLAQDKLASSVDEAVSLFKKAKAGERVLLKDGTYKDAVIKIHNENGTKDKQVTFAAQTPGKVFFEGNSTLSFSGNYVVVTGFTWRNGGDSIGSKSVIEFKTGNDRIASHCSFTNNAIIQYSSQPSIDNKWISIYGEYNTVSHCLLQNKNNLGATVTVWLTPGKEAHHTISHNYFHGRQNGPKSDNGLESIRIGDSKTSFEQSHCVVALNRFEECDGEIEIISNKSFHNSYLHNSFVNSDGGLTLRHGNECLADGNYFDGGTKPLSYGVRFIGEGHVAINNCFYNLHGAPNQNFRAPVTLVTGLMNTPINGYFQVKRAVVADNIFINCDMPAIRVGATPKRDGAILAPDILNIINNIIVDNKGTAGAIYQEEKAPAHSTITNNKYSGKNLTNNTKGFEAFVAKEAGKDHLTISDKKGNVMTSANKKASQSINPTAGANWVEPAILNAITNKKYTIVDAKDVGPSWVK
jgi:poly(beta-D-mannuronate) lyase